MKGKLIALNESYGKLEKKLALLAGTIVVFIVLLQMFSIFSRAIFNQPIASAYELVRLLFLASVFLGISYVQGLKEHVGVEIISEKLPDKIKKTLEKIGYVIAISITFIITWQSGLDAIHTFVTKDYTMGIVHIPLWPAKFSLTFGMFILLIRLIIDLLMQIFVSDDQKYYIEKEVN